MPRAGDQAPLRGPHWKREHFIPVRKSELVALLLNEPNLSGRSGIAFEQLCRLLSASFHFHYHGLLENLKDTYAAFDPDAEAAPPQPKSDTDADTEKQSQLDALFADFAKLLERCNFQQLSHNDIEEAMKATSEWGINLWVDFDVFERLDVYARGDIVGLRGRRRLWNWYRTEQVETPIYQRLVLIFRLRDGIQHGAQPTGAQQTERAPDDEEEDQAVYIKIFKNIPKMDLEMLLPGARVRMTLLDQTKIFVPTLAGVGITLFKIVTQALTLLATGIYGLLVFLGLVGGTIGYGVKSFLGYMHTKDKYQLNLTRSLFYQNLDNNAGVLFRLIDEAEEQEFREAILAYFIIWREPNELWTEQKIDAAVERFLMEKIGLDIDFEVDDALQKLVRLELVEKTAAGNYSVLSLDDALACLDKSWDNFFPYHKPGE